MTTSRFKIFLFILFAAFAVSVTCAAQNSARLEIAAHGEFEDRTIRVPLLVGGVARMFALDTGATSSSLRADRQTKNFPKRSRAEFDGFSSAQSRCVDVAVPRLRFAEFERRGFPMTLCDSAAGIDNLGADFFRGLTLILDFSRHQLRTSPRPLAEENASTLVRYRGDLAGLFGMPVGLSGHLVKGLFDTGSTITSVSRHYVETHPDLFQFVPSHVHGTDVNGRNFPVKIYKIKTLQVGALKLKDVYVDAFDFGEFGASMGDDSPVILGNNVILAADWAIDLKRGRWAVKPLNGSAKDDLAERTPIY